MIKQYKRNYVAAPKETDNESESCSDQHDESEAGPYDSMVENGTDEGNSSGCNDAPNIESDEAFSECKVYKPLNKIVKKEDNKRKRSNKELLPADPTSSAKKTKLKVAKAKPPTLEEINELKETRNLFHSNLLRLQIKEMLTELKIKDKFTNYVSTWLETFSLFLSQLDSQPEKQDFNKMDWLHKCAIQVPLNNNNLQLKNQKMFNFQFIKPTETPYLIGAASTKTLLGSKIVFDVAVTMPAACFQKDNFLNLVYDQKRAFYITYIAQKMIESKHFSALTKEQLRFNYYANNPLKPVLEVYPHSTTGSISNKLSLRIFIAAEETSFKLSRFVPWNNNVRATILCGEVDNNGSNSNLATPNYNANVLFDLTMKRNQQVLQEVFSLNKNIQEGLVLLKVWLRQRQFNVGFGGFHSHIMAMFIAYLFKHRKLHTSMSSYQVARNVWNNLAYSNWDEKLKGITLCSQPEENAIPNQPNLEQYHAYYDVVFVDVTGSYNICANLSPEIYRRVRTESKLAVEILNNMKLNSFQLIFMMKRPIYSQCDHFIKINKTEVIKKLLEKHADPAERYNFADNAHPQLLKIVTNLLRKGLGQRVDTVIPIEQPCTEWAACEKSNELPAYLHMGLILNPEHSIEVLDKGPQAIDAGAAEFRKFWGEKAQLRRFQDGSITEAVVWGAYSDTLAKKRLVVRSIVMYLLKYHLQVEIDDIEYLAGEFDVAFKLSPLFKSEKLFEKNRVTQDTDAEALSLNVIRSFDDLGRKLSSLSELPLEIVSISGISPVFRYCDPTPIIPQARCIQEKFYANSVQRGVIQLGASGKWPEELIALRALKIAFYIQIAQLLRDKYHLRCKVTLNSVLVLKQGYVFGIEIAHQKEVTLLKRNRTESGITKYVDCEASIALEKRHYMLPKVTGALHGLYQAHPSFGPTVMIAKRWLYSQLIDDGLWPDECTELLIASQYLTTHAQQLPCQPQIGFFRFLQLLAYTDWKTELFLINFNDEMDENERSKLETRFTSERESYPPLCIATSYDLKHYGRVWTSHSEPNVNVLARVTILARQALSIIEPTILSSENKFIKASKLFMASSQGYDLVVQLKPDLVANSLAVEFGSPFAAFSKPNFRLPLADTCYLKDSVARLREAYSDYAAFFYNPCGGKEIGVVWKPNIFDVEKEFKVNEVNGHTLCVNGAKVQCKKEVLVEDFKVILKDFYFNIGTVDDIHKASKKLTTFCQSHKLTTFVVKPNITPIRIEETLEKFENKKLKPKKGKMNHTISKVLKKKNMINIIT